MREDCDTTGLTAKSGGIVDDGIIAGSEVAMTDGFSVCLGSTDAVGVAIGFGVSSSSFSVAFSHTFKKTKFSETEIDVRKEKTGEKPLCLCSNKSEKRKLY